MKIQILLKKFFVGGSPKIGKSWLVLLLGLKTALGERFLCWDTNQSGVLYLAFEDNLSRLKERMNKLLDYGDAPPWFHFSTETITLDEGLLEQLEKHLKEQPQTKLIIIDTFKKIRGQTMRGERWYDCDYREAGRVKEFADKHGIGILLVTHTNKTKDTADPFNELNGTSGFTGSADNMYVLKKASRHDRQSTLHITGRDIEQGEKMLCLNEDTCQWEFVGDADELEEQETLFLYQSSPIVKTIKNLLNESADNRWSGSAKNLLDVGEHIFNMPIAPTSQALAKELAKMKDLLYEKDKILYTITPNGTAGSVHRFCGAVKKKVVECIQDDIF